MDGGEVQRREGLAGRIEADDTDGAGGEGWRMDVVNVNVDVDAEEGTKRNVNNRTEPESETRTRDRRHGT